MLLLKKSYKTRELVNPSHMKLCEIRLCAKCPSLRAWDTGREQAEQLSDECWPQASQFLSLSRNNTATLGLFLGQLVEDSSYSPLPISYARNPRGMKGPSMLTNVLVVWIADV